MKWSAICFVLMISLSVVLNSCTEVDENPVFPDAPRIELLELKPTRIVEFQDSLEFHIYYEDGNGDIGFSNFDSNSIFIRDLRFERSDSFYLGPIGPEGIDASIQGTMIFYLPGLFRVTNRDEESTRFELKIKDRQGNLSNVIETEEVIIVRN